MLFTNSLKVIRSAAMNSTSIPESFRRTVAQFIDAPAVRLPGRSVSFREMDDASERIAAGLAARGIGKGDRVGLYCINGPEFAQVYLGVLKCGGAVVPLNLLRGIPRSSARAKNIATIEKGPGSLKAQLMLSSGMPSKIATSSSITLMGTPHLPTSSGST